MISSISDNVRLQISRAEQKIQKSENRLAEIDVRAIFQSFQKFEQAGSGHPQYGHLTLNSEIRRVTDNIVKKIEKLCTIIKERNSVGLTYTQDPPYRQSLLFWKAIQEGDTLLC